MEYIVSTVFPYSHFVPFKLDKGYSTAFIKWNSLSTITLIQLQLNSTRCS